MEQSEKNYQKLIKALGPTRVKEGELLSNHTTFKIGGPADLFFEAKKVKDLTKAVKAVQKLKIPYFILGGGSNLLVSDLGFRGMVIKNLTSKIRIIGLKGKITKKPLNGKMVSRLKYALVEAESGVVLNRLVRFTLDEGLSGLEYFLGQPGTVGGAVFINAHNLRAGKFFGDIIKNAKILTTNGEVKEVEKDYFCFGYDKSIIQQTKEIVLSVILKLIPEGKRSLWKKAEKAAEYRKKTQPKEFPSSGCIFKNIKRQEAILLGTPNLTTSTGFLIESVGLKGFKIGQAKFSEVHANFIVNLGGARCEDVLKLINIAKAKVKEKYGIVLKEEICKIGEFQHE